MTCTNKPIDIRCRLELFVDRLLIDSFDNVVFKMHEPHLAPAVGCMPTSHYMTVLHDQAQSNKPYRAYYRTSSLDYTGECYDGNPGEFTALAISADGMSWEFPHLGIVESEGSRENNGVFRQAPYCHNFTPFIDINPNCPPNARYKALGGLHPNNNHVPSRGLYFFQSPDGIHWSQAQREPVITFSGFAFDSQNIAFWSEAENSYVCYFRMWQTPHGFMRSIAKTTSSDFIHWTPGVPMNPNLPGEQLYTSQITPYFRAPHHYLALPTRFQPDRGSSTDILFMSARAGVTRFDRLFTEAIIRPGMDPNRWCNRSNYAAAGILPTGSNGSEISIFHGPAGRRYTLRTDGFISLHAGFELGMVVTNFLQFSGSVLTLNLATSAAGSVRVELQDETGRPIPGRSLDDCPLIFTDSICHTVSWTKGNDLSKWQGRVVRLKFELREADIYAIQFVSKD